MNSLPGPRPPAPGPRPRALRALCLLVGALTLVVPGSVLAVDYDADDNGCPDPDRFDDFEVTHTADTGIGLVDELEPHEVPTSPRTPNMDDTPCSTTPLKTWCLPSRAYLPVLTAGDDPPPRDHLFLWFPGLGNAPEDVDFVPQTAAFAGYRTINLSYDSDLSTTVACPAGLDFECDSGCLWSAAEEFITGVDDPSTDYPARPMRGIEGKLALALEHLHEEDVNTNGSATAHWDDFCDTDGVRWDKVEVGGFSLGAQSATYISYMRPGDDHPEGNTIGVLAIDAGAPVCGDYRNPAADPTLAYYPDEFDDHTGYVPCGDTRGPGDTGPAPDACPDENRFMMMHANGSVDEFFDTVDLSLEQVSIETTWADIDTHIDNETLLDAGELDASFGNLLRTSQTTADPHGSMGADAKMPLEDDPNAVRVASDYYLMPLYLQAICELDQ